MEIILIGILAVLVLINLVTLFNVVAGPFLKSYRKPITTPLVSVLVPARNEERNLKSCLDALSSQTYSRFEVLVLDDRSTDSTFGIAEHAVQSDPRIRVLKGEEVPAGWTGKNWACVQLSRQSKGEIVLFMDADVRPGPAAVENLVAVFERFRASGVSAFPQQRFNGWAAQMIIPLMDVFVYGMLPLRSVMSKRFVSLLAANGQWLAFTREAYEKAGTHEAVRSEIVEDMALARLVKKQGMRFVLTSGVGAVECTMYNTWQEILGGFSKNFFAAFNFRPAMFLAVLTLMFTVFVLPFGLAAFDTSWYALAAVALNLTFRLMMSARFGHGVASALLHPLGVLGAVGIGLNALRLYYIHGEVRWKDRSIIVR